jgi:hypothetical protein
MSEEIQLYDVKQARSMVGVQCTMFYAILHYVNIKPFYVKIPATSGPPKIYFTKEQIDLMIAHRKANPHL